jgi:hypothetical protein
VVRVAENSFLFRPVDVAAVKGLSKRVNVYELCAALDGPSSIKASERQIEMCRRWAPIYTICAEGDWAAAESQLRDFVADFPEDPVARHYLDRCERHLDRDFTPDGAATQVAFRD